MRLVFAHVTENESSQRDAVCSALGRSEEHQDSEFFLDVVKPVLDFGRHKEHGSRRDLRALIPRLESRAPAHDVVHFVFAMRALRIDRASRENIKSSAHRGHAQEFLVLLVPRGALRVDFANREKASLGVSQPCTFRMRGSSQLQESSDSVSSPLSLLAITRTVFSPGYCPF
jgi:hypothetical protein